MVAPVHKCVMILLVDGLKVDSLVFPGWLIEWFSISCEGRIMLRWLRFL